MSDKLTVETLEETIMKLNKVPTEIIHFTCASCGKENDTPYAFLSLYRQRTICENCYRKEQALELRALLSEEGSKDEWALYRYRCTGDRKWLKARLTMTNRERINNMTNEELYQFIVGKELEILKFQSTSFHEHFLDWLDKEATPTPFDYGVPYNYFYDKTTNRYKITTPTPIVDTEIIGNSDGKY